MTLLDRVRQRRQKLADVIADDEYSGIRRLVEDTYPDQAHFLYELLQNAEDVGARETRFELHQDKLVFAHNGRPFSDDDVWGITNIGKGTKQDDDDKIGRFGVGFKAVFAYSETPHVYCRTASFKISNLVMPHEISSRSDLGAWTRFEFPFNNHKKPADVAFSEIAKGLNELAETTLLFLTNIESVAWTVNGGGSGEVLRVQQSEHHFEILRLSGSEAVSGSHFLKFVKSVEGLERQHVAVAFDLDFLPDCQTFNSTESLHKQLRIVPSKPGKVAVFFPAEKETSGLRFHLHAPFVPELSRASVKESPANLPLFQQLAILAANSLHKVRDLKLLNADFLAVLPNFHDDLPERYECIRDAVIDAMNTQPLTPTSKGSHAPAENLLQAKAVLKELLSKSDLAVVYGKGLAVQWAVSASQRNSDVDRFLAGLDIRNWDVAPFSNVLAAKLSRGPSHWHGPDPEVAKWLSEKPAEWHQRLYAMLHTELSPASRRRFETIGVVRLRNGNYSPGRECFFLPTEVEDDDILRPVDEAAYSSGKSKLQQENARKFLVDVGVREVGEAERVEAILKRRYTRHGNPPHMKIHFKDLKQFMALVKHDPGTASMVGSYSIFQGNDGHWHSPGSIYLDSPYAETSLSTYYGALGEDAERVGLSTIYLNCGSDKRSVVSFAAAVGATTKLEIERASCRDNPESSQLVWGAGGNWSDSYGINEDYTIPQLESLLSQHDSGLARLVWITVSEEKKVNWYTARYRNNSKYMVHEKPSQLACMLRDKKWIPQANGHVVSPAEASQDLLLPGFTFDAGWKWLATLNFGLEATKKTQDHKRKLAAAQVLGFDNPEVLERAKLLIALPKDLQDRMLTEYRNRVSELPNNEPRNPERRAERVGEQAAAAPERQTEERTRTVSINRDAIKSEASQYLQAQYTNADGNLICQVCKSPVPFKRNDGLDFFERVEFLPTLKKHYSQNYLCLCPNHAAMFQHANGSEDLLLEMFGDLRGNELEIVLGQRDMSVYFTKTHLADLRTVIHSDGEGSK